MVDSLTAAQLRNYVDRVLRLKEEIKALNADVSEIYKKAKGNGFDKAALQATVKRAGQPRDAVEEADSLLDLYWQTYVGDREPSRVHAHEAPAPTPHDPDTGEVIEPATETASASTGEAAGLMTPCAPAKGDEPGSSSMGPQDCGSGAAERPEAAGRPDPIPVQSQIVREPVEPRATVECPDLPASLKRDPATNRAPWMDKVAAE